jgi:oligopeptide transport system substrate-binding protein
VTVAEGVTVAKQLFEGLLGFNQDLSIKAVTAEVVPSTANGGISSDGKTYTFRLRGNVTWSDGKPVTAADYEYSIKRLLDPALAAGNASFYYNIVGAQEYNEAKEADDPTKNSLRDAVAVRATSPLTLEIKLKAAEPTFLAKMALWAVYPVRQDVIEQHGDGWTEAGRLIGNGPFILQEWVHQDHITLKPNPNYWGEKPVLQTITLRMMSDHNAAVLAYRNNELDLTPVPVGTEKATLTDPTLSQQTIRYNTLVVTGFIFNVNRAPFDSPLVRQAIATAIDRDAYVDQVRAGVGKAALSWVPPGMPGYDADLGMQYKFDAAKAKNLLSLAGYPNGQGIPPITFSYADTSSNRVVAQFLQANMKQNLSIDIVLDPRDPSTFGSFVASKQHQWVVFSWGADYPDPENFLSSLYTTGTVNNFAGYSNARFDDLARSATVELDTQKRLQMWAEAQQIINEDLPIVPVFYRELFWLKKPNVQDLHFTPMDSRLPGDFFLTETYISN